MATIDLEKMLLEWEAQIVVLREKIAAAKLILGHGPVSTPVPDSAPRPHPVHASGGLRAAVADKPTMSQRVERIVNSLTGTFNVGDIIDDLRNDPSVPQDEIVPSSVGSKLRHLESTGVLKIVEPGQGRRATVYKRVGKESDNG